MAAAVASPPPPVHFSFEINRADGSIYNPWTLADDKVKLRSFIGSGAKPGDFVAPAIRVAPGQKLTIDLDNRLEACTEKQRKEHACFNDTNLHTHGLWVSPSGNSDNVLVSVAPGEKFRYEYDIPADHPAGTFWFHPHLHGSGFVQVGSGMAGMLIVTGNRKPTAAAPGDVDILLKDERGKPFAERHMIFQQIQYGCLDEKGAIEGKLEKGDYVRPWTCAPGKVGGIESPDHDWDWINSGRFTGINGKIQPVQTARTGEFERWRLVHAGTRERIRLKIRRLDEGAPDLSTVNGAVQSDWIEKNCRGPALPMWQIALDGLTRSDAHKVTQAVLFPGERMDLIVRLPEAGRYCLIHDATPNPAKPLPLRALGVIEAKGRDLRAADTETLLRDHLVRAAESELRGAQNALIRAKVVADLRTGMKLSSFAPHKAIAEEEVSGYREAIVNIVETPKNALFQINGRPYEMGRIDHVLPLGKAEEWRAVSLLGNHPLHIHVNPFQIVSIMDSKGNDVMDPASPAFDPDYADLKGEWKDTVMLKQDLRVAFRTRYERFTGDFVIHCHIMFHGDHGMMQNLRIAAEGEADRPFGHPVH
ncbi:MAG TPA: multicopper oxidase family protein [Sphingomicrobium sp.]|nr:multicopper oxidase family protein [Sphingomicrobium sp.]